MKKILILSLAIFLASCTNSAEMNTNKETELTTRIDQLNEKIVQLEQNKDNSFQKNQACLKMKEALQKELDVWHSMKDIKKIFYSKKDDTCLVEVHGEVWGSALYDTRDFSVHSNAISTCGVDAASKLLECESKEGALCGFEKGQARVCDKHNALIVELMK